MAICHLHFTSKVAGSILNRPNRLMFVDIVATYFPTWIIHIVGYCIALFLVAEEYIRTKVTRHTNDEYELFTRVHTSKCVVTFVLSYQACE